MQPHQVARGKYLVGLMSCTDCHTPGHFLGKEDATKYLGGSDVGFAIPGLGVFVGPNLTPDKDTGLGNWTPAQIVTALTKGETPEGRILAPPMPWRNYANITKVGRAGDRGLSQDPAAGVASSARPIRPQRNPDHVRHDGAAGRCLCPHDQSAPARAAGVATAHTSAAGATGNRRAASRTSGSACARLEIVKCRFSQ